MSKEPEAKDSTEAGRKRRGGLRVPSDNVPRRAGSESEVAAPVPEPVGLAASVSESFGVDGGDAAANGKSEAEAEAADKAKVAAMEKMVSETTQPDNPRLDTDEEVTQVVEATSPEMPKPPPPARKRSKTAPVPPIKPISQQPSAPEEVAAKSEAPKPVKIKRADTSPGFVPPGGNAIVRPPMVDESEKVPKPVDEEEEEEEGDSVDIPFDDNDDDDDEATINTPIPEEVEAVPVSAKPEPAKAPEAAPAAPSAKPAVAESDTPAATPATSAKAAPELPAEATLNPAENIEPATPSTPASPKRDRAETVEGKGSGKAGKKKPRFQRALTMALNESDLEEVRAQTGGLAAEASPVEEASPVDSGDVIAEDDMEEISAESVPAEAAPAKAPPKKKRADTAEPPPPPPKSQKAAAPPKPAPATPAPKKPSAEDAKRRQKKPWFEELFDEDYLRTLPFLTPQATQFEANFVMESLGVDAGAQILDVGCGYGRHAMELAARGYHLVGLDSSLPLLLRGADEAQRRGLTINFVHGDMRDMTYESQFDGAYCLFSSFGYFDDETNKRTAQNIAKALKPGARFVVEVLNRDYLVADLPSRVWWEGDGCVVLEEVEFNYFSSRIVSNRSVVFDDGRQLEHEISLRSFSLHELGKFLHAVGFRVLEISGSMSTRGRFFGAHSRDIVVVAERRATKADES